MRPCRVLMASKWVRWSRWIPPRRCAPSRAPSTGRARHRRSLWSPAWPVRIEPGKPSSPTSRAATAQGTGPAPASPPMRKPCVPMASRRASLRSRATRPRWWPRRLAFPRWRSAPWAVSLPGSSPRRPRRIRSATGAACRVRHAWDRIRPGGSWVVDPPLAVRPNSCSSTRRALPRNLRSRSAVLMAPSRCRACGAWSWSHAAVSSSGSRGRHRACRPQHGA